MSLDDHKGAAFPLRQWMREAQSEIDRGERKGARRLHWTPTPRADAGWLERKLAQLARIGYVLLDREDASDDATIH